MTPVNAMTVALTVAASSVPSLDQKTPDANDVKPGWIAFVVIMVMSAAVVVLLLSFRKQLRKVDANFPSERQDRPASAANGNGHPAGRAE